MKFFKFSLTVFVLTILLFGAFVFTAQPRDSLTRSHKLSVCYNTGYSMGCEHGLIFRGDGLPFSQNRINFLKTQMFRRVNFGSINAIAKAAWKDGYNDGWKDGYYMTTDNYDNIWKPWR